MAAENRLRAKENRRRVPAEGSVDYIFLILVLLALTVGLTMLYSASSAQSRYDTGYRSATRGCGRIRSAPTALNGADPKCHTTPAHT